jgi:hypothetical protein
MRRQSSSSRSSWGFMSRVEVDPVSHVSITSGDLVAPSLLLVVAMPDALPQLVA